MSYNITYQIEMKMIKVFLSFIRFASFAFSKKKLNKIAEEIIRLLNSNRNLFIEISKMSQNYCENDIVYRCDISFENSFKINQKK